MCVSITNPGMTLKHGDLTIWDRFATNTLLSDHEKLSYEFLQWKKDLEQLRVSYEDLQKEGDSLLAQQISATRKNLFLHF